MEDSEGVGLAGLLGEIIRGGARLSNSEGQLTQLLVDEVLRLRAWEGILTLFFARYYTTQPDPIAAAESDRDLLARLAVGRGDEEGARQVEGHYQNIIAAIEAGQQLKAWRDRKRPRV